MKIDIAVFFERSWPRPYPRNEDAMLKIRTEKIFVAVLIVIFIVSLTGCKKAETETKNFVNKYVTKDTVQTTVKVTSVALEILQIGTQAYIEANNSPYAGIALSATALMKLITPKDAAAAGMPPNNVPVLVLINKKTDDIKYWELTDRVKMIRIKDNNPGSIDLKILNQKPLRIELWVNSNIKEIDATVEFKN
ncbi:MAG: hypothetical protein M0Z75_01720 [Nitrospiraceae bacterium]|nr:hypothetical protein [Nitrospiraceae bacterium]